MLAYNPIDKINYFIYFYNFTKKKKLLLFYSMKSSLFLINNYSWFTIIQRFNLIYL